MMSRTLSGLLPSRRARRYFATLALVLLCLTIAIVFAGAALADESSQTTVTTSAGMEAPKLDYHFVWWSFVLTFGLLAVYYFIVLRISDTEFKKIIDAHFGPKQDRG
jgi:hypothetical protein